MPSILPGPQSCPHYEMIQARWKDLAACAAGIIPTKLPLEPEPDHFMAIEDEIRAIADKFDALLKDYGSYLQANANRRIDEKQFTDVLIGALEGNTFFEIEEAAEAVRERMMEDVS